MTKLGNTTVSDELTKKIVACELCTPLMWTRWYSYIETLQSQLQHMSLRFMVRWVKVTQKLCDFFYQFSVIQSVPIQKCSRIIEVVFTFWMLPPPPPPLFFYVIETTAVLVLFITQRDILMAHESLARNNHLLKKDDWNSMPSVFQYNKFKPRICDNRGSPFFQ